MQDRNKRQNQLDHDLLNRRHFMGRALWGIGASALSHLLPQSLLGSGVSKAGVAPRAKRVIYLFMSGAPSQLDLYDHKPQMEKWFGHHLEHQTKLLTHRKIMQSSYLNHVSMCVLLKKQ